MSYLWFFIFKNKIVFIIIINEIIANDIIFKILMKCFKKFQDVKTKHNMDIISDIDSNIMINIPIILNGIEFKQLSFLILFWFLLIIIIIYKEKMWL